MYILESRAQLLLPCGQVARKTCLPHTRTHLPWASGQVFSRPDIVLAALIMKSQIVSLPPPPPPQKKKKKKEMLIAEIIPDAIFLFLGQVLCSACCNMKFSLAYMEGKEGRVCQVCCNALLRGICRVIAVQWAKQQFMLFSYTLRKNLDLLDCIHLQFRPQCLMHLQDMKLSWNDLVHVCGAAANLWEVARFQSP